MHQIKRRQSAFRLRLRALVQVPTAGDGRLFAHMPDGSAVPLSRTGSKGLRALIV